MQTAPKLTPEPALSTGQTPPRGMEDVLYKVVTVGAIIMMLSTVWML